jgi:hypothetical protein
VPSAVGNVNKLIVFNCEFTSVILVPSEYNSFTPLSAAAKVAPDPEVVLNVTA